MRRIQRQRGYALLLIVLMFMGLGGVVAANFSQNARQSAEQERYLHNQRVLREAKQALLRYAYSYPEFNDEGPGRLPCPDTDNDVDGLPGDGGPLTIPICTSVGRFPWGDPGLRFYDARDATGERLWYAVSDKFHNLGGGPGGGVNSDSFGSITVVNQAGDAVYDGGLGEGIAAVIIAPGAITRRDQDNDGNYETVQLRGTPLQRTDPRNYMDTFAVPAAGANNQIDNSVFTNDESNSNDDGFILGPIFDPAQSDFVVNDQMIIITADEVIEMAEKRTLQAYRDAINEYIANTGTNAYPWLDDYATTDLTVFDADINTRIGRVPSLFANYFAPTPDNPSPPARSITSDVEMNGVEVLNLEGFVVPHPTDLGVISANAQIEFDNNGDLIITPVANGVTTDRFYWDEIAAPDGWQECLPADTGTEQDCHQALASPGVPDSSVVPNELATRVVRVRYVNNMAAGTPFTRALTDSAGLDPVYQPPTAAAHARVALEYSEILLDAIGVEYRYDDFFLASLDDIQSGGLNYRLQVTYYPVLPEWVLSNDWHNSMQMSFAQGFAPGAGANCVPGGLPPAACITVNNSGGVTDDKAAVLVLAGEHGMGDADDGLAGFSDDLAEIFDLDHRQATGAEDDVFAVRAGDDEILVID
ncbi:MAG: type II secretion system protein [Gammaproteobacteria bacterium]|nr:type II secretion system protein [Gammaproteobacteria bacterium]